MLCSPNYCWLAWDWVLLQTSKTNSLRVSLIQAALYWALSCKWLNAQLCLQKQSEQLAKHEATFLRFNGTETIASCSPLAPPVLSSDGRGEKSEADKYKTKVKLSKGCTLFMYGTNSNVRWQTSQYQNKSQSIKLSPLVVPGQKPLGKQQCAYWGTNHCVIKNFWSFFPAGVGIQILLY